VAARRPSARRATATNFSGACRCLPLTRPAQMGRHRRRSVRVGRAAIRVARARARSIDAATLLVRREASLPLCLPAPPAAACTDTADSIVTDRAERTRVDELIAPIDFRRFLSAGSAGRQVVRDADERCDTCHARFVTAQTARVVWPPRHGARQIRCRIASGDSCSLLMVAAAPRSPSNCVSEGTVRNYLSEAISKVGGRNRVDAARIARSKGWL